MSKRSRFLISILAGSFLVACNEPSAKPRSAAADAKERRFKVRVLFENLVGLALTGDQDGKVTGGWALLLDASEPEKLPFGNGATRHHAKLSIKEGAILQNGWKGRIDDGTFIFDFDGDDLELVSDSAAQGFSIVSGRRQSGEKAPTNDASLEDISWIPDMRELLPKARFKSEVLATPARNSQLSARVRLDRGTLKTFEVHRDLLRGDPIVFDFANLDQPVGGSGRDFKQALSHITAWEIESEGPVTISKRKLTGGTSENLVISGSPGGLVEVRIENSPVEVPDEEDRPSHFLLFYNLLDLPQTATNLPYPVAPMGSNGHRSGGDEACPGFKLKVP